MRRALPTAFALEALSNELAYLAGPALIAILGASGYPAAGTVLAATSVVTGGLCFAAQRSTAPPPSDVSMRPARAARCRGRQVMAMLAVAGLRALRVPAT